MRDLIPTARVKISLSGAVVAPGLTVMAVILFMGALSGAHLNTVVSIASAPRTTRLGPSPARSSRSALPVILRAWPRSGQRG
jgi:hypothetical protein